MPTPEDSRKNRRTAAQEILTRPKSTLTRSGARTRTDNKNILDEARYTVEAAKTLSGREAANRAEMEYALDERDKFWRYADEQHDKIRAARRRGDEKEARRIMDALSNDPRYHELRDASDRAKLRALVNRVRRDRSTPTVAQMIENARVGDREYP